MKKVSLTRIGGSDTSKWKIGTTILATVVVDLDVGKSASFEIYELDGSPSTGWMIVDNIEAIQNDRNGVPCKIWGPYAEWFIRYL